MYSKSFATLLLLLVVAFASAFVPIVAPAARPDMSLALFGKPAIKATPAKKVVVTPKIGVKKAAVAPAKKVVKAVVKPAPAKKVVKVVAKKAVPAKKVAAKPDPTKKIGIKSVFGF